MWWKPVVLTKSEMDSVNDAVSLLPLLSEPVITAASAEPDCSLSVTDSDFLSSALSEGILFILPLSAVSEVSEDGEAVSDPAGSANDIVTKAKHIASRTPTISIKLRFLYIHNLLSRILRGARIMRLYTIHRRG